MTMPTNMLTFTESGNWDETHYYGIEKILFSGKTKFQDMMILKTRAYGKLLVLDGRVQSAQEDEYIYHESLVHPGLIAHPDPRKVLIIGGGEGATLREVLRHPSIEYVAMVDLDQEVVERCRELLPEWHQGAFDDARSHLFYADGEDFIKNTQDQFDCVIIDICDALEDGPALELYTEKFYNEVKKHLRPGGVIVVQAMELYGLEYKDHVTVQQLLRQAFRSARSYTTYIPSFWCNWGYVIASDDIDVSMLTQAEVNERIKSRNLESILRYFDGETYTHMFSLPKDVRRVLALPPQARRDVA